LRKGRGRRCRNAGDRGRRGLRGRPWVRHQAGAGVDHVEPFLIAGGFRQSIRSFQLVDVAGIRLAQLLQIAPLTVDQVDARLQHLDGGAELAALQVLPALLERLLHLQCGLDAGLLVGRQGTGGGHDGAQHAGAEQAIQAFLGHERFLAMEVSGRVGQGLRE
jgi:hypothetical protein